MPHLTLGLLWQIIKVSAPLPKLYKFTKGPSSAEFMHKIEKMDMARFLAAEESVSAPEQIILQGVFGRD